MFYTFYKMQYTLLLHNIALQYFKATHILIIQLSLTGSRDYTRLIIDLTLKT